MSLEGTYSAESHARIDNDWLIKNANDKNAVFDCRYPDGNPRHVSTSTGRAGQPRFVIFKGNASTDGAAAIIHGYLWGENSKMADDYYLTAGVPHELRFLAIYARGTTARGIKILY